MKKEINNKDLIETKKRLGEKIALLGLVGVLGLGLFGTSKQAERKTDNKPSKEITLGMD